MEKNSGCGNCANCCILVGALRILCYKCCRCRSTDYEQVVAVELNVLCLGLEGAGKSTLLATLSGESTDNIEPTSGFSIKSHYTRNCLLHIKELGGSDKIRKYWNRYYNGQQGVIVVIDTSEEDPVTIGQSCEVLKEHLDDPRLRGLPLLILYNSKSSISKVTEDHYAMSLVHDEQPFLIENCSAKDGQKLKSTVKEFSRLLTESLYMPPDPT